jgi:hypothetical protein
MPGEVRVAVEIRDYTPLDKSQNGRRIADEKAQPRWRAKTKAAVAQRVECRWNSAAAFVDRGKIIWKRPRHRETNVVLILNHFLAWCFGTERENPGYGDVLPVRGSNPELGVAIEQLIYLPAIETISEPLSHSLPMASPE